MIKKKMKTAVLKARKNKANLFAAGIKEITKTNDITVIKFFHDLQFSILPKKIKELEERFMKEKSIMLLP